MIAGIGADIVAIGRVLRLLERHGSTAAGKILADEEIETFQRVFGDAIHGEGSVANSTKNRHLRAAAAFLAKRFAAKEALAKAFGTGFRAPLTLSAITVRNNWLGQPFFAFSPKLSEWIWEKRMTVNLSISDERDYALAFVVLEQEEEH